MNGAVLSVLRRALRPCALVTVVAWPYVAEANTSSAALPATADSASSGVPAADATTEQPERERPGLTPSGGLGYAYGWYGLQIRYDRPLRPWLHAAPFLAVGVHEQALRGIVGAAGLSAALGWRYRLAADFAIAPVTLSELRLHGTHVDWSAVYGPNLALGFEMMTDKGSMQRVMLGYGWGRWDKGANDTFPSTIIVTLGIGGRIWSGAARY